MELFDFSQPFGDARLAELKLLSLVDRNGDDGLSIVDEAFDLGPGLQAPKYPSGAWHDMIYSLINRELLFFSEFYDLGKKVLGNLSEDQRQRITGRASEILVEQVRQNCKTEILRRLFDRATIKVTISHEGRIRLSELKQSIRGRREREPFGILWDVRHWQTDLDVAILDASATVPLSVAFMDMNGLKQVNDTCGHDAGDDAIRSYLQAISSTAGDDCQGYRIGGDEALVIMPNHTTEAAVKRVSNAAKMLMREAVKGCKLSLSAGISTSTDPTVTSKALKSQTDAVQYTAKAKSKESSPRPSVIAVEGVEMTVIGFDDTARV